MENVLDMLIDDRPLDDMFYGKEFTDFSNTLMALENYNTMSSLLYIEAVEDQEVEKFRGVKKTIKNTADTTKGMAKAYNSVTDTNAGFIKGTWDLIMKVVNLMVRAFNFIMNAITKIPTAIVNLVDKISRIPGKIKNKIKGNISLYITVNDLELLYNKSMLKRLDDFLVTLDLLTQGEMWGTFFNRAYKDSSPVFGDNDMKLCRKMDKIYGAIRNVKFQQTVIDMSDQKNVDIYFGNETVINFTDLKGKSHSSTYYQALIQLMEDINLRKDTLARLQEDFGKKFEKTEVNQSYARMSSNNQKQLAATMQQISAVVGIIGNLIKYVSTDIKTMDKELKKLTNVQEKENSKETEEQSGTHEGALRIGWVKFGKSVYPFTKDQAGNYGFYIKNEDGIKEHKVVEHGTYYRRKVGNKLFDPVKF